MSGVWLVSLLLYWLVEFVTNNFTYLPTYREIIDSSDISHRSDRSYTRHVTVVTVVTVSTVVTVVTKKISKEEREEKKVMIKLGDEKSKLQFYGKDFFVMKHIWLFFLCVTKTKLLRKKTVMKKKVLTFLF